MTHTLNGSCTGKIAFDSPRLAHTVNARKARGKDRTVYRCKVCGKYHLGTPDKAIVSRSFGRSK